jgi:hypothetical protein
MLLGFLLISYINLIIIKKQAANFVNLKKINHNIKRIFGALLTALALED